ncbi:MAG: nucleotide exchange factor GrpE [Candidatus Desulforudis sp.]|nr:nucleotide exchange factor GrpE [Desulforudis sp.]
MDNKLRENPDRENPSVSEPQRDPAPLENDDDRSGEETAEVGTEDMEAQLAAEAARDEEYQQQLLRLQADFDNFRRRTRQERDEWFRQAAEDVVAAVLPVLDNFERALEKPGDRLEDFLAGVRMIHRQLEGILADQGLERVPGPGGEFNPSIHEAVARVETGEAPENMVIEELRPGYYFRGRVIRPAMVKVAKPPAYEEGE